MIKKHSVRIAGHPTSVTLEEPFWEALGDLARRKAVSLNALIEEIDQRREELKASNLSSAIRIYVLQNI